MSTVITLEKDGPVAVMTLNRPEILNPLGQAGDGEAVRAVCQEIEADPALRCAVLTGAGRAFSAGGDVKAMRERSGAFAGSPNDVREGYLEVPLIAAVNGPAIGLGCDVACMADIRIASERAKFGVTFLKLGLIPGDGGAWLLPRIIGTSRAAEMLFTGKVINAQKASDWGLVSETVDHDTLMDASLALAADIAAQPPQTLRLAKTLLRHGTQASYETIMEMSAASQALMHHTEDHIEGVEAILEKRPAEFKGR